MADMLEYLAWRGDLPFSVSPFCEPDCLVLCRAAYFPMDGIVPMDFLSPPVAMRDAADALLRRSGAGGRAFRRTEDAKLAELLRDGVRFGGTELRGFADIFDSSRGEQFSAVTAAVPEVGNFVLFRGTDGTLVGWKEDFNMAFSDGTPAQRDAVSYMELAAANTVGPIRAAGHSKGGNLAMYAASFCSRKTQRRIVSVRNMDGPGFNETLTSAGGFAEMAEKTRTFVPQSSVFGMLLGHMEDFSIVHSVESGLFQHDLYSWEIGPRGLAEVEKLTNSSQFVDASLRNWLSAMDPVMREEMVDCMFDIFGAAGVSTLGALGSAKSKMAILKAVHGLDPERRGVMQDAIRRLRKAMKKSLPVGFAFFGDKRREETAGEEAPRGLT